MFRQFRILALLGVLLFVTIRTWWVAVDTTDWNETLQVVVYPINADHRPVTLNYLQRLQEKDFDDIEIFIQQQARRYGWSLSQPVRVVLEDTLAEKPPMPPSTAEKNNFLSIILWSLRMRYWASKQEGASEIHPDIQLFINYFDPQKSPRLGHSLGLKKGVFGVINAFAREDMSVTNNVIITHELMHVLGASDKYNAANNQPLFPMGYANAEAVPLFPQSHAEIMGGRIPLSFNASVTPVSLKDVVVGKETALEINWLSFDEIK